MSDPNERVVETVPMRTVRLEYLLAIEWKSWGSLRNCDPEEACPACGVWKCHGHAGDCWLSAALKPMCHEVDEGIVSLRGRVDELTRMVQRRDRELRESMDWQAKLFEFYFPYVCQDCGVVRQESGDDYGPPPPSPPDGALVLQVPESALRRDDDE